MSSIEDSYEGAVQRLRRLEQEHTFAARPAARLPARPPGLPAARAVPRIPPGLIPPPPPQRRAPPEPARLRDLEQLATLACEENERLEAELAEARAENARLQRRVATMEATLADPRAVLGLPPLEREEAPAARRATPRSSRPLQGGGRLAATLLVLALGAVPLAFVAAQPMPPSLFGILERAPLPAVSYRLERALELASAWTRSVFHGPIPTH